MMEQLQLVEDAKNVDEVKTPVELYEDELEYDLLRIAAELPVVIPEECIECMLPGVIKAETIFRYNMALAGPKGFLQLGNKNVYITKDLLHWLAYDAIDFKLED